jgi:hypothetical protein
VDAYLCNQYRRDLQGLFKGVLGGSSSEKLIADYLNRALNDFLIDLLYYLNASAVGNLSLSGEMVPMSEFQRNSQEWKHHLSVVDRIFVGEPTI